MTGHHTSLPSNTIQIIGRTVDRVRVARGMSRKAVQRELGWAGAGQYQRLMEGQRLSGQHTNDLRIWIRKWSHVLEAVSEPDNAD